MIIFINYLLETIATDCKLYMYKILSADEYKSRRLEGEIIRNTHSIEKGLSLESVRMGFGYKKIQEAFQQIDCYVQKGGKCQCCSCKDVY